MNKLLILAITVGICVSALTVRANEKDTTNVESSQLSSYGSVFIKSTRLMEKYNPQIGGMGAVVFRNKIAVGPFGNGLLKQIDFRSDEHYDAHSTKMNLKYGYGGLFVQYYFIRNSRFQVSVPVKMGFGLAGVYEEEKDIRVDKSRLLVLEPEIHLDIKTGNHVAISAQFGYRMAGVRDLCYVSKNELSGFSAGLGLKFISR
ncbi:MAG: hypothetical protein R2809_14235 [Flavobacteriales bacterium]